jgi:hypothetical protein
MSHRTVALLSGSLVVLVGCGGESSGSSADASVPNDAAAIDAGADATLDRCPASMPGDGTDCFGTNDEGFACLYGTAICTCKNLGQNSASWFCSSGDAGAEAGADAGPLDCTYDDGGATLDASSRFQGSCAGGCPPGTVCAVEIGGVAGGGGEYCAPIVDRCKNDVTCACLASCVCGSSFGRPEKCADTQQQGTVLDCDNGIR